MEMVGPARCTTLEFVLLKLLPTLIEEIFVLLCCGLILLILDGCRRAGHVLEHLHSCVQSI